ncbi:MAG: hypothetical protein KAQ98_02925 [Bacteriovoracaceae bacterium]|nr:hypothetical protein [Bacteriovoracaceae bacterium]
MKRAYPLLLVILIISISCATSDDPLKNTKKLVKEGHSSLYNNGAFKVPKTKIKLIPPGPDTLEITYTLVGIKARDSFLLSLKNAASSYNLVKAGTLKSLKISKKIHTRTGKITNDIGREVKDDAWFLISKSAPLPKKSLKKSIEYTRQVNRAILDLARRIDEKTKKSSKETREDMLYDGYLASHHLEQWGKRSDKNLSTSGDRFDKKMRKDGRSFDHHMKNKSREKFKEMLESSKTIDNGISDFGKMVDQGSQKTGKKIYNSFSDAGRNSKDEIDKFAEKVEDGLYDAAKTTNLKTQKLASTHLDFAKRKFIQGYVVVPENIGKRVDDIASTLPQFSKRFKISEEFRKKYSGKSAYFFSKTLSSWGDDFNKSVADAKNEFTKNSKTIGYTLGSIKAMAWLTKAFLWDVSIKPLGKASAAGLGYLSVNTVAYPTTLVVQGGVATTKLAVEVVKGVGGTTYDLIAPTAIASVAGVYSLLEYTGGKIAAGTTAAIATPGKFTLKGVGHGIKGFLKGAGKSTDLLIRGFGKLYRGGSYLFGKAARGGIYVFAPVATATTYSVGKVSRAGGYGIGKSGKYVLKGTGKLIRGTTFASAKGLKSGTWAGAHMVEATTYMGGKIASNSVYVGVPLASVGIPTTGTSLGVAVGGAGIAAGSSYYLAGQAVAGGTYVFGNTIAGTTLVGGVAVSAGVATTLSAYEVGKGIAVPSSYTLGSGIVLTYGALVHLSAQGILAVSDASYLVLSMEGPRWVIYAVSGKLGKGDDLPGGTILDIEKMKKNGEEFKVVPASSEELKKVIQSVQSGK